MSKKLVAYFSTKGVTKKLAETFAEAVDGDLFEIVPVEEYTDADLNWMNPFSRSSVEMRKDKSIRPEVKKKLDNMDEYDVIYVGFPIWWGIAPTIVNTFLEQYDMNGKTIVPFATSGGSGIGRSGKELEKSASGATILEGEKFSSNSTVEEIKEWIEENVR